MTWFTDSPFEKMMTQRPNGRRENAPSVSHAPACKGCAYKGNSPCVGFCIYSIKLDKTNPNVPL